LGRALPQARTKD